MNKTDTLKALVDYGRARSASAGAAQRGEMDESTYQTGVADGAYKAVVVDIDRLYGSIEALSTSIDIHMRDKAALSADAQRYRDLKTMVFQKLPDGGAFTVYGEKDALERLAKLHGDYGDKLGALEQDIQRYEQLNAELTAKLASRGDNPAFVEYMFMEGAVAYTVRGYEPHVNALKRVMSGQPAKTPGRIAHTLVLPDTGSVTVECTPATYQRLYQFLNQMEVAPSKPERVAVRYNYSGTVEALIEAINGSRDRVTIMKRALVLAGESGEGG